MYICNVIKLSSFGDIDEISNTIVTSIFIMHIIEIIFSIISWFLVTYIAILLKGTVFKLFHINICFFLTIFFVIYYFHFVFRSSLFVICYANTVEDVSPDGPLKWLHVGQEFSLFVGGISFPLMYVERFYASRDLKRYEKITNVCISFTLTLFAFILVIIFEVTRSYGLVEVVVMPFIILGCNLFSGIGMYFIVKNNKLFLQHYYSYQLSVKLQMKENIRACSPIFPNLILATCSASVGAVIYGFAFYTKGQIGLLLSSLFDCGISFYMCTAPIILIIFVKELRKFTLISCFKTVRPREENEQNIYFQQLRSQWS